LAQAGDLHSWHEHRISVFPSLTPEFRLADFVGWAERD
jgi:hypothetical protein